MRNQSFHSYDEPLLLVLEWLLVVKCLVPFKSPSAH